MARQRESLLRDAVADALKPLHVVKVENGLAGPGTPDLNYGGQVRWDPKTGDTDTWRTYTQLEGWIELKRGRVPPNPDRAKVLIGVRKEQPVWWNLRARAGGRVHVLVELDDTTRGLGTCLWFNGRTAGDFLNKTKLDELIAASVSWWERASSEPFEFWLRRCLMR
jgi:hypothetical protein